MGSLRGEGLSGVRSSGIQCVSVECLFGWVLAVNQECGFRGRVELEMEVI